MEEKKVIGYIRVSTIDQDTYKNRAEILELANQKNFGRVEFVEEKISGTKAWQDRKIGRVIAELQQGDVLIVPEISRLARSMLQILEMLEVLKKNGVDVYAVKGGWSLNGNIESKVLLLVFGMMAEIERDLISLRTKEGLAARRAMGVKLGRPSKPGKSRLDQHRTEIEQLLRNGSHKKFIAGRFFVTPGTLTNWLKKNKINIQPSCTHDKNNETFPLLKTLSRKKCIEKALFLHRIAQDKTG
uniref:Putative resolvase domain containing protein n=1 Tax=viral metagenome TaxID=1070528 RepID=A0A6M3JYD6_9ZZZZ